MKGAFGACLEIRFRWIEVLVLGSMPNSEFEAAVLTAEVFALVDQLALAEAFAKLPRYGDRTPPLLEPVAELSFEYQKCLRRHRRVVAFRRGNSCSQDDQGGAMHRAVPCHRQPMSPEGLERARETFRALLIGSSKAIGGARL